MNQETKKATFIVKKDTLDLLKNVSFLLNETRVNLVNQALEEYLNKMIKEKNLESFIESLNQNKS
jgi:hypothetical protein